MLPQRSPEQQAQLMREAFGSRALSQARAAMDRLSSKQLKAFDYWSKVSALLNPRDMAFKDALKALRDAGIEYASDGPYQLVVHGYRRGDIC